MPLIQCSEELSCRHDDLFGRSSAWRWELVKDVVGTEKIRNENVRLYYTLLEVRVCLEKVG